MGLDSNSNSVDFLWFNLFSAFALISLQMKFNRKQDKIPIQEKGRI